MNREAMVKNGQQHGKWIMDSNSNRKESAQTKLIKLGIKLTEIKLRWIIHWNRNK